MTICHIVLLGLNAMLGFFPPPCHFVRKCKVSVIVSDVTAQATGDSQLSFHMAAVVNSVYMMKVTQEHINKCSVVGDKKQCHLIRLLSKHMFCLISSHFRICWFSQCVT
jgi:hypothetical protein